VSLLALLVSTSLLSADALADEATTYTLDPAASLLWVRTFKDTSLTHDHAVHATGWSGTVTWDPADVSQCAVNISVPVSGLVVDEPSVRQVAGITAEAPDEGDRVQVKETMLSADQLDAKKFSTVTFTSTSCSGDGESIQVSGTLTVHGVAKALTVPMTVSADGASFSASGSFKATHADFGMEPFSFLLGAFQNGPDLAFGINVKGAAQ
jgi:polyisoprenoid-binding protein YceI